MNAQNFRDALTKIDLATSAKEKMRSAFVLNVALFNDLWKAAPDNAEAALREEDEAAA
jgi:hypothetical protein